MHGHGDFGEIAVGGAPSWCVDPEHCDHSSSKVKECGKCKSVPHLPAAASTLDEGSRSVWVYFPQGIRRRPVAESDLGSVREAEALALFPHECHAGKSLQGRQDQKEIAPRLDIYSASYPGHALFQDSYHFCKFKKFGDAPGLSDIYVEIVLDGYSGMAFAKVYSELNAMNATDILKTRVTPFFSAHGVPMEQVFTQKTQEYCGMAPAHPYETFLSAASISHMHTVSDGVGPDRGSPCEHFYKLLQRDFLGLALRTRYRHTVETLQSALDDFVESYNSTWPSLAPGMHGQPAMRAFLNTTRA